MTARAAPIYLHGRDQRQHETVQAFSDRAEADLSWAMLVASQLSGLMASRAWRRSSGRGVGGGDGLPAGLDLDGAVAAGGADELPD